MPSPKNEFRSGKPVIPVLSLRESRFTRHSPELGIVAQLVRRHVAGAARSFDSLR
jgi:hypothetical protein